MSYAARVFSVLIASPSDVAEEREIAVSAIQAWNNLNSAERQLVLLPLKWETHSSPEYGKRPQEVINRQVVDNCDLLIGVFWTRIGSPTGVADSGTIEEIDRVAKQGKPVMLYFSQAKQDPDKIDLDQLRMLREFKNKTYPKALVEVYSSHIEFRDKLSAQLEIQIRTLLSAENQSGEIAGINNPKTDIKLEFVNSANKPIGDTQSINSNFVRVENVDLLPDYKKNDNDPDRTKALLGTGENTDFYRDMVEYVRRQNFYRPLRFWLKNTGGIGARDVYIELRFSSENSDFILTPQRRFDGTPPIRSNFSLFGLGGMMGDSNSSIEKFGSEQKTHLEIPALQPQREILVPFPFLIGKRANGTVDIDASIYADTLPAPIRSKLHLNFNVNTIDKDACALLKEAGVEEDITLKKKRSKSKQDTSE